MTQPLLLYAAYLVDEGFSVYAVSREGLSGEVDDLATYLIVTCDGDTSVYAS